MSKGSKLKWGDLCGLAILLCAQVVCLAGTEDASAATAVAFAPADNANPYSVIIERNVFHLNQPPLPPKPDEAPPPVIPEVRLSGFMRTGDQWKVLLAVQAENPDPHGHPLTCYLTLAEGDKKAVGPGAKQVVVELVKAYADQEKADIINSGTPVTLSVKDNGFSSPSAVQDGGGRTAMLRRRAAAAQALAAHPATGAAPADGEKSGGTGSPAVGVQPSVGVAPSINGSASNTVVIAGGARETPP
jgi:hypothetical protein